MAEHLEINLNNGLCMAWRDVTYTVGSDCLPWAKKKTILNGLSGSVEWHTLVGLMGPSGAGKTTLLNCLAGNKTSGLEPHSQIYFAVDGKTGKPPEACFIQQHVTQTIVAQLDVGETLAYAYRFKNTTFWPGLRRMKEHIDQVLEQLLLNKQVLGRPFKLCSGGEQKRIAIAQELMAVDKPPSFLFIDEPTTGLDSNAALLVMQCLRRLTQAAKPLTIVTSIHSPSAEVLALFHDLYVLAKGGVTIFAEPPGQLAPVLTHQLGVPLREDEPPIETLLRLACNGTKHTSVMTLAQLTHRNQNGQLDSSLASLKMFAYGLPASRKPFSFLDLFTMFTRQVRIFYCAESRDVRTQIVMSVVYISFMTFIFQSDMTHPAGCYSLETSSNLTCLNEIQSDTLVMQNIHFHGMLLMFYIFVFALASAVSFAPLAGIFQNEYRNRWYNLGVFYCVNTFKSFASHAFMTILLAFAQFFISGQLYMDDYVVNWTRLGYYAYFLWLSFNYGQALGELIGVIFMKQPLAASLITQLICISLLMFNGYCININPAYAENNLLAQAQLFAQQKPVFDGLLWTIFYFQRCDNETQYSEVLRKFNVDAERVMSNSFGVLWFIVAFKVSTLIYFYFRFNSFVYHPLGRLFYSRKRVNEGKFEFNFQDNCDTEEKKIDGENLFTIIKKTRTKEDEDFIKFASGKISIAWRHLSIFAHRTILERAASVSQVEPDKMLLKDLNGYCRFGTLTALMGTSGAGKTTLLKALNGRDADRLSVETQIYLSRYTKIVTCFITQDVSGHLLPGLTAGQMLIYASRLKNSKLKVDHDRMARELLEELNMLETLDTPVERCSGGERKRLAVALELASLHMPNLVCIDEPTSGLDSNSAAVVVACLRSVAIAHNISIVASVHQPTSEVMRLFHSIYVLARGGVCIYAGPPGSLQAHLDESAIQPLSPFPIENLIKCSSLPHHHPNVSSLVQHTKANLQNELDASGLLSSETVYASSGVTHNHRRASLTDAFNLFLRYLAHVRSRNWILIVAFISLELVYGYSLRILFPSSVVESKGCLNLEDDFNNTCTKTPAKILDDDYLKLGFQYFNFTMGFYNFIIFLETALEFSFEIVHFLNEHRNGWYSTGTFFLVKNVVDLVLLAVKLPVYTYVINIYENSQPGTYWYILFILFLSSAVCQALGYLCAAFFHKDRLRVILFGVVFFFFNILLSDYYAPAKNLHYLLWLYTNSFNLTIYLTRTVTILLYGFDRCLENEIQVFMYKFEFEDEDLRNGLIAMTFLVVFYRIVSFMVLIIMTNQAEVRNDRVEKIERFAEQRKATSDCLDGFGCDQQELRIKINDL